MSSTLAPHVKSYPERLSGWLPLPYWLSIIILWEIIYLIDYFISFQVQGAKDHLPEFGLLILFFAFTCVSIVYCSKVLTRLYSNLLLFIDHPEGEFFEWYQKRLKISYHGIGPLVTGVILVVLERLTTSEIINQLTPPDELLRMFRDSYRSLGFFFVGMGIWSLFQVLLIPIHFTRFKIKVSMQQVSGMGLQALGGAYFRMSLSLAITFFTLVAAALVSPLRDNISIVVWQIIGSILIFCFFLVPQIGVHRIMSSEKQNRLVAFSNHLEDGIERSLKEPTVENMQRLKELFELQKHLREMNEWPFNVNTLWQLITALLIPMLLALLEIIY